MVESDRELKLAGYEVYRFGAVELQVGNEAKLNQFFEHLFKRYDVPVSR